MTETRKLKLGVAGLGRGFMLMLPTFRAHPLLEVVAAADPRAESREQFARDFGGRSYARFEDLCDDVGVDAIYIATPHQFHAAHVVAAAARGRHVMVEKPMAITLAECATMIEAAQRAGTHLLVGHSHSYDAPYLHAYRMIRAGTYGAVRMIHAMNYTDFMYRPRRPEELDTAQGGGVVFSQGAHQVDIVRMLGGGKATSVRARTGNWDPARNTEGAYTAILDFANGAFASLTYSGYAHFDTDELTGWIGEMGNPRSPAEYGAARRGLAGVASADEEAALKGRRAYGVTPAAERAAVGHNHFGPVIASCDRADLRPLPGGVMIHDDARAWLDPLPPGAVPRAEVIDELHAAVVRGIAPLHDGQWAMATLEVCLGILESARDGSVVRLTHQVEARPL
jgi:phthalate 4,5-cis-dihydrodiol dehydrogenase